MENRYDKMVLFINDQIRLATEELEMIPASSPSFKVMRRILVSLRDMIELIQSVRPEPGEDEGDDPILILRTNSEDAKKVYGYSALYWAGREIGWTPDPLKALKFSSKIKAWECLSADSQYFGDAKEILAVAL